MSHLLETAIKQIITYNGSLSVAAYWSLCLSHPEHGYYMNRDPLGTQGDFTTAPEISQLFGEMVGIWVVEQWYALGSPAAVYLVEAGPGRGTLMADILRIGKIMPEFLNAVQVHLIETSPSLQTKQGEALKGHQIVWHEDLTTLPNNAPIIFVANEFLDALPIQQYMFQDGQWCERVVGLDEDGQLAWGVIPTRIENMPSVPENSVLETSQARENFVIDLCTRIKAQRGMALLIDYGHDVSGLGDTLQAVKGHQYADVLKDCGDADITSHVDFGRLKTIAEKEYLFVDLHSQGEFLTKMGIHIRARQLMQKSNTIEAGLRRLVDDTEMGKLFRVMEIK